MGGGDARSSPAGQVGDDDAPLAREGETERLEVPARDAEPLHEHDGIAGAGLADMESEPEHVGPPRAERRGWDRQAQRSRRLTTTPTTLAAGGRMPLAEGWRAESPRCQTPPVSETVQSGQGDTAPRDETARYASLLASGERVILVRQRHWLTFLEAGRWFVLALAVGLVLLVFGQSLDDGGISGFFGTILDWGFWIFLTIGVLGVGWYFLVWRVERYLVTTRRVIEAGGVINKYSRDTTLSMITDMLVGHPWLGRIVGYGEIDLLTGAEAGRSKIRFLPDADGFKKALLDAKHEYEMEVGGGRALQEAVAVAAAHPAPAAEPAAPSRGSLTAEEVDASLSRLADMRDRGLVTQAEFDEKKRELLDRL